MNRTARRNFALAIAGFSLVAGAVWLRAQEGAPPAVLGSKEKAKWSATTLEAAAAPENRKVLDNAKVATVIGEVIDISCYTQMGKRGAAHVECGRKCLLAGQPGGILDDEGNVFLLMAEQHHPRRDGQVSLAQTLADLMSKRVVVTGMLTESKGLRTLFVEAPPVPVAAPPADAGSALPTPPVPPPAPAK
jgi:hypothetical protein